MYLLFRSLICESRCTLSNIIQNKNFKKSKEKKKELTKIGEEEKKKIRAPVAVGLVVRGEQLSKGIG